MSGPGGERPETGWREPGSELHRKMSNATRAMTGIAVISCGNDFSLFVSSFAAVFSRAQFESKATEAEFEHDLAGLVGGIRANFAFYQSQKAVKS